MKLYFCIRRKASDIAITKKPNMDTPQQPSARSAYSSAWHGFKAVFQSFTFIAQHRLWPYYIYPILIDVVLSASFLALLFQYTDEIAAACSEWLGVSTHQSAQYQPLWSMLTKAANYSIEILIWVCSLVIYFILRKNLLILCSSPIMSLLSDRVSEIHKGQKTAFNGPQFVRGIWRSSLLSLRNVIVELLASVIIFFATFFIGLLGGPLAFIALPLLSAVGFMISSYYFGTSLVDYALERQQMSMGQTIKYNRENRMAVIGIGAAFHVLLWIPVIGISLSVVLGTTGATLWQERQTSSH
jgi:uncharacterized protein involved in cysteine biosynthesis